MHLEVKVALNFIVSYLYNKLPRRRADLFGEELERLLMSRFEGHWYPDAPLRGSAFRCLHLGVPCDPVVELAAKRSGLDTEEVRANVPAELSVWIDPYEVSYQIGEKGAVKVLYLEDQPGLAGEAERADGIHPGSKGEMEVDEAKSLGFNPEAQVFVPIGGQVSPVLLPSLSSSPPPLPATSCSSLFGYPTASSTGNSAGHSTNTSSPPPPQGSGITFLPSQQQPLAPPNPRPPPQPITFTTASFAATKFGSTKMKKCSGSGPASGSAVGIPPQPRMLSRSPTTVSSPGLLKHKPLSLSLHSLGGQISSQLSPNAKEFVYPASPGAVYFDTDAQPLPPQAGPFQSPHSHPAHPHSQSSFDPFSSTAPGIIRGNGGISYVEKTPFAEGLGGYNLQYPSQAFQPVVLAN
ncbi:protein Tob2 [Paramormyrops kingsleyae]|uniref:protein Tob2 n=1 Tax=Paramormyrops kingsleyae TaxID=1676925 RepID=UPI000CD6216B|nr:protein Tob2-like [Paramormyrops kingsleyae]XP_023685578.1 protein Tob2-like [Paramormyrops kingsleyae]